MSDGDPARSDAAIVLRGVSKSFGPVRAVDDLTLVVPRGSVYGFVGPNGSGKTTTLRMIMNILYPDAGDIEVLGERTRVAARDRVSYLPEERGLYKRMTARQIIRYYARLKGDRPVGKRLDDAIAAWIERMGAAEWADKKVESLSKGMAQKVQIIAAAVTEPELAILDEPFSGLDPVNTELVKEAVLEMKRAGTTIVFSTHDMSMAEKMCDRIFMIFRGKKVLDGTLAEIQDQYGADVVVVRTAAGARALDGIPGIESVNDSGNEQEIRVSGDPQAILRALVERTEVRRFELTRPSLHDIFVRIARPHDGTDHESTIPVASKGAA